MVNQFEFKFLGRLNKGSFERTDILLTDHDFGLQSQKANYRLITKQHSQINIILVLKIHSDSRS